MRLASLRAAALLAVLAFASAPSWAQPAQPGARDAGGLPTPRMLRFEVSDYRDAGGGRWIRISAECEIAYRESLEDVIATLWDFPDSPKVFSRIESVRVRSDDGTSAVTEQRTAVRVLGLAFISDLVFSNAIARRGAGAASVTFETIETDGSCLSAKGAWDLEDISGESGAATYVKYSIESYVEPRFPGQAAIIRAFGAGDVRRLMRELGQAIARS